MAHAICNALGLSCSDINLQPVGFDPAVAHVSDCDHATAVADDAAIVLTHKLRWHDAEVSSSTKPAGESRSRMRRPHFAATGGTEAGLTLFARED